MIKTHLLALLTSLAAATTIAACAADAPETDEAPTKDEARGAGGKSDGLDLCAANGWYGDLVCDDFCPQPDPDCDACSGGCPEIFNPVCGTDGVTYDNDCFSSCAGATTACEGECPCSENGGQVGTPCSQEIALECPEGEIDACLTEPPAASTHFCVEE